MIWGREQAMMTYEFDAENKVITLRASGVLVVDDPIDYFRALDNDPAFRGPAEKHVYFTGLEDVLFSYQDAERIKKAFLHYNHGAKLSRVYFIVDSDLTYGMARMVLSVFNEAFTDAEILRVDKE